MLFKARKESDPSLSTRLLAEAADWLVALEGVGQPTCTDRTLNARFYDWLMHSPERLRAFLEICNVYSTLNEASCGFIVASDQLAGLPDCGAAASAKVVRLKGQNRKQRRTNGGLLRLLKLMGQVASSSAAAERGRLPGMTELPRLSRLVAGIAGVLAAAACAWLLAPFFAAAPAADIGDYSTRIGERTIIPFEDGSTVYLNTASRIMLRSSAKLHSVRLLSGEVLFDAPTSVTPFRLGTDGLQIDSVGAQFDVRRESTQTWVSVLNGRVHLSCRCAAGGIVLTAGEQLEVSHRDGLTHVLRRTLLSHERDNLVMWRDGHLFFEGESLAAAVKELNRYNREQLVVGDAATADLRIGGRFSANDVDSFVAAIQRAFGVRAQSVRHDQQDSYIVLLSREASETTPFMMKSIPESMAAQQHRP